MRTTPKRILCAHAQRMLHVVSFDDLFANGLLLFRIFATFFYMQIFFAVAYENFWHFNCVFS